MSLRRPASIFGVLPALAASDQRLGVSLNEESRGGTGSAERARLRAGLVVAELALSLVLLAGASLLVVSFNNLLNVSPGFEPAQLVIARHAAGRAIREHARTVALFDAVLERWPPLPAFSASALTTSLPFDGDGLAPRPDDRTPHGASRRFPVRVHPRLVSPGYFQTLGIPLVRGRAFTDHDAETSPNVVIINEAAARRYWPNEDPMGQRIDIGAADDRVARDRRRRRRRRHAGLDADTDPAAYLPQRQRFASLGAGFERTVTLVVRTTGDAASVAPLIQDARSTSVDPQVADRLGPSAMDDLIGDSIAPRRLNFVLVVGVCRRRPGA